MAAVLNDRDIQIQLVSPRVENWTIGSNVDFTGTLNGELVQDVIDAAYSGGGDFTESILENSGTTITVNSSVLFEMPGAGSGGTFIGGGGIFGKNSAGTTKFSVNSSTGLLTAEDAIISGSITVGSTVDPSVTVSGTPLSTVNTNASNGATAFTGTTDFRVAGAPTNQPVIGAITVSSSTIGTVDITLNWTYTQGARKAETFILYYLEGTTNPTIASPVLAELDGDARSFSIMGVPIEKSYKVGIVASRLSSAGVQSGAIVNAWTRTGGTANVTAQINGVAASTVTSRATDGYTAFQDTIDFRVSGAPTNSPVIGAITTSSSAVGNVDIKLTWTYTQGGIKADSFILYYLEGTTNPTTASPILAIADGDTRDVTISGVPMDKSYKIGIVAARKSSAGIQKTAIVNAWTRTGATANITANIDGTAPSGVKNTAITLSSSGSLLGAGGGSITALDYSNVSGTKPPATATENYFTTSASDPTGGVDGNAHWNSTTSTMWFKTGGVWRVGGTVNAGQITTGTLAAARIAASSITSDKISVSTLSAIAANLGTVTAGNISGTSNITITGSGKFDGATADASFGASAVLANKNQNTTNGITGYGNSGSGGVGVVAVGTGLATAFLCSGRSDFNGNIVQGSGTSSLRSLTISSGTLTCGTFSTSSTSLVTNLNADYVDGYHAASFCRTAGTHGSTATVSGGQLDFLSTVSGVSTQGGLNDVTFYSVSDIRLKFDINPEELGMEFINRLRPCTYRLKDRPDIKYHGFIAQDVGEFIDESENDCFYYKNPNGYYGTDYPAMTAPIVKALQQLSDKVEELENEIKKCTRTNARNNHKA